MLTFAEVCGELRMSPKTVRKLIVSGELEAFKAGTSQTSPYRITEDALAEFIKRQTGRLAARVPA